MNFKTGRMSPLRPVLQSDPFILLGDKKKKFDFVIEKGGVRAENSRVSGGESSGKGRGGSRETGRKVFFCRAKTLKLVLKAK